MASSASRWGVVATAFAAGVIGAAHIGKVPVALPAVRAEMGVDLVTAGWIVSIFSATGLAVGAAAGGISDRFGHARICIWGMALLAAGSALGGFAWDGPSLLAARFAEGLGFLAVVVAAPSIIAEAASASDRRLAVGIWGAFMPAGMSFALLAAPSLMATSGWRGTWWVMAGASVLWVGVMTFVFRGCNGAEAARGRAAENLVRTVTARGPWLLALCFGFYTLSWLALMVWLPTFVVEQRGGSTAMAATLTLVAVAINFPGNLTGGWLLSKGVRWSRLAAIGAAALVVSGPLIYLDILPDGARFAVVLAYSFASGMVPAAVLGGAPYFSPGPAQIGTTNGLIIQGSHLGQFVGPPLAAAAVGWTGGWDAGAMVFVACGLGVGVFAALIGAEDRRLGLTQGSASRR